MIHFVRSPGRLAFVGNERDFSFARTMQSLGAEWSNESIGWGFPIGAVPWESISRLWGMRSVCVECLLDTCQQAAQIIAAHRQRYADLWTQFYTDKAVVRRGYEPSASTEIEVRPSAQAVSPTKQAAAAALGLGWPVEHDEIVRAFRKAAFESHPDRNGGSDAEILRVLKARDVLLG